MSTPSPFTHATTSAAPRVTKAVGARSTSSVSTIRRKTKSKNTFGSRTTAGKKITTGTSRCTRTAWPRPGARSATATRFFCREPTRSTLAVSSMKRQAVGAVTTPRASKAPVLAVRGIPQPLSHGVPELSHYLNTLPVILGIYLYTAACLYAGDVEATIAENVVVNNLAQSPSPDGQTVDGGGIYVRAAGREPRAPR